MARGLWVFALAAIVAFSFMVGGPSAAASCDSRTSDCPESNALKAPSREFPTIQSAIDAAADGARIDIGPGHHWGPFRIDGKTLILAGKPGRDGAAPTLSLADRTGAILTLGPGGGADVRRLAFRGGAAALDGLEGAGEVHLKEVDILGSGIGVRGIFAALHLKQVTGRDFQGDGLSVVTSHFAMKGSSLENGQGVGVHLWMAGPGAEFEIVGAAMGGWAGGGIHVHANHNVASGTIKDAWVVENGIVGLALFRTDHVEITGLHAERSRASPGDHAWGDNVIVVLSTDVHLKDSVLRDADRSGATSLGSVVSIQGTVSEDNPIDLDYEEWEGVAGSFEDLGGNHCYAGGSEIVCRAMTSQPLPPEPD